MYRGMYLSMVCISEIFMEPFCVRSVEVIDRAWQSSEYGEAVSDLTGLEIPLTELLENARSIEDSVRDIIENASQMLPAPDAENITDIDPSFG